MFAEAIKGARKIGLLFYSSFLSNYLFISTISFNCIKFIFVFFFNSESFGTLLHTIAPLGKFSINSQTKQFVIPAKAPLRDKTKQTFYYTREMLPYFVNLPEWNSGTQRYIYTKIHKNVSNNTRVFLYLLTFLFSQTPPPPNKASSTLCYICPPPRTLHFAYRTATAVGLSQTRLSFLARAPWLSRTFTMRRCVFGSFAF